MDFDAAILAHAEWKGKLARYLAMPDGSLDVATIANDRLCELGKWIFGEAALAGQHALPEYTRLIADHASFHKQAAQIVERTNKGALVSEHDLTDPTSPYAIASRNVIAAIRAVKAKAPVDLTPLEPRVHPAPMPAIEETTGRSSAPSCSCQETLPILLKALQKLQTEHEDMRAEIEAIKQRQPGDSFLSPVSAPRDQS